MKGIAANACRSSIFNSLIFRIDLLEFNYALILYIMFLGSQFMMIRIIGMVLIYFAQ